MSKTVKPAKTTKQATTLLPRYSVEFFHIYVDETIGRVHDASIQYLTQAQTAWQFPYELIVLIDDYNPTDKTLEKDDVLKHLENHDAKPHYWAYEGDLTANAQKLLDNITKPKLKKNYERYIEQHGKYPCSLLTASWYLTRLGALPHEDVIHGTESLIYEPAKRLINILPQDYKAVETRAHELIANSTFKGYEHQIQDLFYPMSSGHEISLW